MTELSGFRDDADAKPAESYEYDLIGVTVHTGTADGGHYYSFIRDIVNPHAYRNNKWWLFTFICIQTIFICYVVDRQVIPLFKGRSTKFIAIFTIYLQNKD